MRETFYTARGGVTLYSTSSCKVRSSIIIQLVLRKLSVLSITDSLFVVLEGEEEQKGLDLWHARCPARSRLRGRKVVFFLFCPLVQEK